jgi:signal transduction histidine kinase
MRLRSLRLRLLASYLAVLATGAVVLFAVSRMVAPSEFQRQLRAAGQGRGPGSSSPASTALEDLVGQAVDTALLAGLAAAALVAGVVAVFVSRRLLRPIDDVRSAADSMARGEYRSRVPIPAEIELAALAEDVNTLAAILEETETRRGRLIGEVAHELRSPLTTIQGTMEAILDGVRPADDATIALVAREASRLRRLADDLTLLSQAEEGAVPLDTSPTDLGTIASDAVERLGPQFDARNVHLRTESAPAPIVADGDRITQIAVNLLGNALTHTPDGGAVTIRTGTARDVSWLEVQDSGAGIDPAELDRIFERFYRIPDPSHPAGRGIGLTIARSLARAHGGDVSAFSAGPGTGATFRLELPIRGRTG